MIYKRLEGKTLAVEIEKTDNEPIKRDGVILPQDQAGALQYRTAKILQVGEELEGKYLEGDLIHIPPKGRERMYNYKGLEYYLIPQQDVIAVL